MTRLIEQVIVRFFEVLLATSVGSRVLEAASRRAVLPILAFAHRRRSESETIVADGLRHANDPSFDWVPPAFCKGVRRNWHQRRRHAIIRRLLRGITGRVLDYGCGYGDVAFAV